MAVRWLCQTPCVKHHKHKDLGSKRGVRASCHTHRGLKQALSRVQTTSYSRDGHLGPRREQGAEMCQLSKMLTQHKPLLSQCSLLPNKLQEKSSLNCASCCLPRLSWRTSQTARCVPRSISSQLLLAEAICGHLCFPGPHSN